MKNKILIISVIVLAIAVFVVAQVDLQTELNQLKNDLINADYEWLAEQENLNNTDNIMLSVDINKLT